MPARPGVGAAPQSPRRSQVPSGHRQPPRPFDQVADRGDDAEAAAVLARPARVLTQRARLDAYREAQFERLDRRVAHVALADRHRRRHAVLAGTTAPAATLDAL